MNCRVVMVATLALSSCVVAKQYTLKLDAAKPSENKLCEKSSRDPKETCEMFGGQALDSPSTLAITIANADPKLNYAARVEQTSRGPGGDDASAVFHEAISRFTKLASGVVKGTDGNAKEVADAQTVSLERLRKELLERGLDAATTYVTGLMPRTPVERSPPTPADLVGEPADKGTSAATYLQRDKGVVTLEVPTFDPKYEQALVLGMPSLPYPAPRLHALDDTFVAYLDQHLAANTSRKALAGFVKTVCAPASFGTEPYTGKNQAWTEYVRKIDWKTFDGQRILEQLGIKPGDVLAFLQGKATLDIEKLIGDARRRAAATIKGGKQPDGVDRIVHQLYLISRLHKDAKMCATNVHFAAELVTGNAALAKQLSDLQPPLDEIVDKTRSAAQLFASVFEPYLRRTVIQLLEATGKETISFGAFSVAPGTVGVAVSEHSSTKTRDIATYSLKVQRSSLVSVSIGPMVTLCSNCIRQVTEQLEPGAMVGVEGKRILRLSKDDYAYSFATMVNFAFITKSWFQLAGGIGYPLSDLSRNGGLELGALIGLTARHRVGFGISAGLHLFEGQSLKAGYGERIDTSEPGLVGLTVDSVVEPKARAAFFFSVSVDSGILEKVF